MRALRNSAFRGGNSKAGYVNSLLEPHEDYRHLRPQNRRDYLVPVVYRDDYRPFVNAFIV